ncbi:DciA family protein [Streptomyces sp. SID1034]|uniref:DciA family protein n=1 Tax=Streptomyces sp. SID1034 TaxID=2690248 RepID=UPI00136CF216|nr:DciA family protein [Streptomyces sp. SID1034]MYV95934.1 DUF721 domain-containing protein [Streptomyces sp. SID1034]
MSTAWVAAATPELAGHVQAVTFDPDAGRLDVAPDSPAYGTQLRWSVPKLLAGANERVQGAKVHAPAPVKANPATAAATSAEQSAPPVVPAERRPQPTASAGPTGDDATRPEPVAVTTCDKQQLNHDHDLQLPY